MVKDASITNIGFTLPAMWKRLADPLPKDEIKLRLGSVSKHEGNAQKPPYKAGTKGNFLAYHDARHVMDRLDEVFTPDGWSDSYRELAGGAVECTLSLQVNGEWVSKSDVGYPNNPKSPEAEALKSSYSDAFKRAGVKWGIGRYLYNLPESGWWPVDPYGKLSIKDEALVRGKMFDGLTVDPPADEPAPTMTQADSIMALVTQYKSGEKVKAFMESEWDLTATKTHMNALDPEQFAAVMEVAGC